MANVSRVRGAIPVGNNGAANWNGKVNLYAVATNEGTAIFIGDIVKLNGGALADGTPTITQNTATGQPVGVVVNFVVAKLDPVSGKMTAGASPTLDTPQYVAATSGVERYALVADDPELIMEMQEDGDTSTVAVTDVGMNFNIVVGSGSTASGVSGMQIDSSSVTTTNTAPLRLIGFARRVDNDLTAASPYKKCLVKFNTHAYKATTGVTGA